MAASNTHTALNRTSALLSEFRKLYGTPATVYRAPGRVNLIGEHTDYNEGFVLPAAIDLFCWIAIARRNDRVLALSSENFDDTVESSLDDLNIRATGKWADYPLGVAWALE